MQTIKVYTAMAMTGKYCDELVNEAHMLIRVLKNYDLTALNPVLEERIPNEHVLLPFLSQNTLEHYWRRDKELIRQADVLIDYKTQNMSDGTNNEVAYSRYCLWKPTVRVWVGKGALISRIEDDIVVDSLIDAVKIVQEKWGTYEKLAKWRTELLTKSYPGWISYQRELQTRYGMKEII